MRSNPTSDCESVKREEQQQQRKKVPRYSERRERAEKRAKESAHKTNEGDAADPDKPTERQFTKSISCDSNDSEHMTELKSKDIAEKSEHKSSVSQ